MTLSKTPAQPVKVIYIMGSGRSGSTVLDMALGRIPGVVSTGELANLAFKTDFENEYCSCGSLLVVCPFWSKVLTALKSQRDYDPARYAKSQMRYERVRALYRMLSARRDNDADFQWYLLRSAAIFKTIAKFAGAQAVVDSSKGPVRALALSRASGIRLVPVHLVADPRGVAWSLRRAWAADPRAGIQHALKPVSAARAAAGWLVTNWAAERVKRRLPGVLFLRYEDFVAEPAASVERILHAATIDYIAGGLPETIEPGKMHIAAGNRVRRQDKVVIRMDDAWVRKMSAVKKRLVRLIDFPLMAKYGYPYFPRSAKRRIMLVIHSLTRGGAERVLSVMANHWAECGHEVFLATIESSRQSEYYLRPEVVRIALDLERTSRNPVRGLWCNLWRISALRKAVSQIRPHATVSFLTHTNLLVLLALAGSKVPVIVSERIDPAQVRLGAIRKQLRRWLYPHASSVVVQTERVRQGMQQVFPHIAIAVIPNPLSEADPDEGFTHRPLREWLDLPAGIRTISAMGRLDPQKGFDLLIEAFRDIQADHPDWHLVIFGEGTERAGLESMVKQYGLQTRVHLPGQVRTARRTLRETDLFVLSSRFEGFPNALLEAMACGLPVISFDCPSGPAEIITQGEDGILVKPEDKTELAAAMKNLMADKRRRRELAKHAVDVNRRFAAQRIMAKWDDLLESVLGQCVQSQPRTGGCADGLTRNSTADSSAARE